MISSYHILSQVARSELTIFGTEESEICLADKIIDS